MMRKLLFVLALVFAVAFGFGTMAPDTAEAAGGSGGCFFTCSCSGQPLVCCPNQTGGVSCKPTTLWNCPQVYNC
jgi:hypothetical protein